MILGLCLEFGLFGLLVLACTRFGLAYPYLLFQLSTFGDATRCFGLLDAFLLVLFAAFGDLAATLTFCP